jgi:hypothetical protein
MLNRVEMDVIDMPGEVIIIGNGVFPKTPLLNSCLTPYLSGLTPYFSCPNLGKIAFGELALDFLPTERVIIIIFLESSNRMQVIR